MEVVNSHQLGMALGAGTRWPRGGLNTAAGRVGTGQEIGRQGRELVERERESDLGEKNDSDDSSTCC
jgi:hypothetical protein